MRPFIQSPALVCMAALVVAAVAATAGPLPDAARAADDPGQPRRSPQRLSTSSADAVAFWTPQRMAAARPKLAVRLNRDAPRVRVSDDSGQRGRRVVGLGTNTAETRIVRASENQPSATYPYPFGRRALEKQLRKVTPYKAVGRIFFRQNGVFYSCSGASVVGKPRNVVFTAGHCLNDGAGNWSTDVVFIPGRRAGKAANPFGTFEATELWVPAGWTDNGWWAYDLGAFSVSKNQKGKTLRKAVGALGFAYDQSRIQHWDIFGYPAQRPWGGNKVVTCSSQHAVDDANAEGPDTIGVGCDMNGGSSGGPWIMALRRSNLLNGITSYSYLDEPAAVFGPYFDATANGIRCAAATGKETATKC